MNNEKINIIYEKLKEKFKDLNYEELEEVYMKQYVKNLKLKEMLNEMENNNIEYKKADQI